MIKKNILIADSNHGAIILLKEYRKYTMDTLYLYDIYNKLTLDQKSELKNSYNIKTVNLDFIKKNRDNFLVITPIHMPPVIKCDYTHHEFTGFLIEKFMKKNNCKFKLIEITGVKGKTTTTTILKNILKDYKLLVLTSHNLIYHNNTDKIIKKLSITPSSIITTLNIAKKNKILNDIDYIICEVSLGVTSNTDISVLTNIIEDYSIAKGASSAKIAKKSIFNAKNIICDKKSFDDHYKDHTNKNNISLTDLTSQKSNVYAKNIHYNLLNTSFDVCYNINSKKGKFNIQTFALSDFYISNILTCIAVSLILKIPENIISKNLKNIKPITGRGSYKQINHKLIFEEINPGLNTSAIKQCIQNLKKFSEEYLLVIGGDYGITCEEINEEKLIKYIQSISPNQEIIFTGNLGKNLYKQLNCNEKYQFIQNKEDCFKYSLKTRHTIIEFIYRTEYQIGS